MVSFQKKSAHRRWPLCLLIAAMSCASIAARLEVKDAFSNTPPRSGHPVSNLIDKNRQTLFTSAIPVGSADGAEHQLIRIDLGKPTSFNHIQIHRFKNIDSPLRIYASDLFTDKLDAFMSYELNFFSTFSGSNRAPAQPRSYERIAEIPQASDAARRADRMQFDFVTVNKRYVYIVVEGYTAESEPRYVSIGQVEIYHRSPTHYQIPTTTAQDLNKPVFDVLTFGAEGDGQADDTDAIQAAVDACSRAGKGTVWIHGGVFLTGAVRLKSNVRLHIDSDAMVLAYADPNGFERVEDMYAEKYPGPRDHVSVFYAENAENITIEGRGVIHGNQFAPIFERHRRPAPPHTLRFIKCRNITVRDIVLKNAVHWVQYYSDCENLVIDNVIVDSVGTYPSDGLNVTDCHNVTITRNYIHSDDDCIVPKSIGKSPVGLSNIRIQHNVVNSMRNRGINIGTDTSGPLKNMVAKDNVVVAAKGGIGVAAVDGADVENVRYENIFVRAGVPVYMRLGNRDRFRRGKVGSVKNIAFKNIHAIAHQSIGSQVTGIPGHRIQDVRFSDVWLEMPGGVRDIPDAPPEREDAYPQSNMFGGDMPAYGVYVRHAENVIFERVHTRFRNADAREWLVMDETSNITITDCKDYRGRPFESYYDRPVPIPAGESELIKEVFCHDTDILHSAAWSVQTHLNSGDRVYGDRQLMISYLSDELTGSDWIRPSMDSGRFEGSTLIEFTTRRDVTVYVAFPAYLAAAPSWLDTWALTELTIMIRRPGSGALYPFSVYKKHFNANAVVQFGASEIVDYNQHIEHLKPLKPDGFRRRMPIVYPDQYVIAIRGKP